MLRTYREVLNYRILPFEDYVIRIDGASSEITFPVHRMRNDRNADRLMGPTVIMIKDHQPRPANTAIATNANSQSG